MRARTGTRSFQSHGPCTLALAERAGEARARARIHSLVVVDDHRDDDVDVTRMRIGVRFISNDERLSTPR